MTGAEIQAALDGEHEVLIPPGVHDLGDTIVRPPSGSLIRGHVGRSILTRGDIGVSYTRPFFDLFDVSDVTFEGLTLEYLKTTIYSELAFHLRASVFAATQTIRIMRCKLITCNAWIESNCDDVEFARNRVLGGGTLEAGVVIGGRLIVQPGQNAQTGTGPRCRNIKVHKNWFENIATEAVDVNWCAEDVSIDDNDCLDCGLDGGVAEVIDVGSHDPSGAELSRNIGVTNNRIAITDPASTTIGITIKKDVFGFNVSGNTIRSASVAAGTNGINCVDAVDGLLGGNVIEGFENGIVIVGPRVSGVSATHNAIRNPGKRGIGIHGVNDADASHNAILSSVPGALAGIQVQADTPTHMEVVVSDNRVRGFKWGVRTEPTAIGVSGTNNRVSACEDGFSLAGPESSVSGHSALNTRHGVNILANSVSFDNGRADDNGLYGVVINSGCDQASVVNTRAGDTRTGGARTQQLGLIVAGPVDRARIVNSEFINNVIAGQVSGLFNLTNSISTPNIVG